MRLLLTADLHYRIHWFRWLIEQAPNYDLICIAGDLLDMFRSETKVEQAREIRTLVKELADRVPVALCSGNHDNAGRLVSHDRASMYEWFIELGALPNIITDGSTRKLENLIVTTIPYHCSRREKSIWFDRGSTIRKQTGIPWIVLHHVPPKTGLGVSGEELEAAELFTTYRPDYFVSGHDHAFPYTTGQSWNQKLGDSRLLVPGQLLSALTPNFIKLDTGSGELSWHPASETWTPEDGMYDHLVLKLSDD
jgi:predicted MPP superfamily phosphohydrolase